jgi:hypothetical protein
MEKRLILEDIIRRLVTEGFSVKQIADITGRDETLVMWYIKEIEEG